MIYIIKWQFKALKSYALYNLRPPKSHANLISSDVSPHFDPGPETWLSSRPTDSQPDYTRGLLTEEAGFEEGIGTNAIVILI